MAFARARLVLQRRPALAFVKSRATFASVCLEDALPRKLPKKSGTMSPSIGMLIKSSLDPDSSGSVTRLFLEKHMGIGEDKMEECMARLSQLLRFYSEQGMPNGKLQKLFRDEPHLFALETSKDKLERLLSVFREAGVEKEAVAKLIRRSPKIVELEPEKLRTIVSYLSGLLHKESKVLGSLLMNRPSLLTLQIEEDLIPKVEFLRSLQVSPSRISMLFQMWPAFPSISLERDLKPRLELLVKHGINGKNLEQVLVKYPWIVLGSKTDLEKAVTYFQRWNFRGRGLTKVLSWRPQAITTGDYEVFATLERFLVETGFEKGTPAFESAFCIVITVNPDCLRSKLDRLLKYGISKDEATMMFRKQASIATISDDFLEAKMRFLLDSVNMKIEEIVRAPVSLTYSLEKRMKPRVETVKWMLAEGHLKKKSWVAVISVSDSKFLRSTCRGHPEAAARYKALCMRVTKGPLESESCKLF